MKNRRAKLSDRRVQNGKTVAFFAVTDPRRTGASRLSLSPLYQSRMCVILLHTAHDRTTRLGILQVLWFLCLGLLCCWICLLYPQALLEVLLIVIDRPGHPPRCNLSLELRLDWLDSLLLVAVFLSISSVWLLLFLSLHGSVALSDRWSIASVFSLKPKSCQSRVLLRSDFTWTTPKAACIFFLLAWFYLVDA